MKKLLLIAAFSIGLASGAFAQSFPVYGSQALFTVTNAASTATNLGVVLDVRKQSQVAISITSTNFTTGLGAGAGSYALAYQRSVDGVNYESTLSTTNSPAPNGATPVVWIAKIDTLGAGYIKIPYLTNAMVSGTNIWVSASYGIKIGAP